MEALLTIAVPAVVKFFQALNNREWGKVGLILLAAVSGAGLGFVTGGEAGIATGIVQGLAGAGIVTVAGKVSPTVATITTK